MVGREGREDGFVGEGRRLHLGVTAWDVGPPGTADQFARQAERAESLGLDSFWLPEFHFDDGVPLPQPLLPLAAVAACTRRLRIGTGSYLLPIRHPVQLAEEVAVLDRLSAGRVILGVGRGYRAGLFDAFGVPENEKRDRFERALETMTAAWAGGPVAWEEEARAPAVGAPDRDERGPAVEGRISPSGEGRAGEEANAGAKAAAHERTPGERGSDGQATQPAADAEDSSAGEGAGAPRRPASRRRAVYLVPRPVQDPHPPIWIAAFGPRALAQAGRLGLPYFASPIESMAALGRNFARFREAWAEAGSTPPAETPIMRTTFISRDRGRLRAARERLAEQAAALAQSPVGAIRRGAGVRPEDWALVGEPAAVRDRIEHYRERFGMTCLIASRTRLPGLDPADFECSLEHLAGLAESLDRRSG